MFFDIYKGQEITVAVQNVQHYVNLEHLKNVPQVIYQAIVRGKYLTSVTLENLQCKIDLTLCCS